MGGGSLVHADATHIRADARQGERGGRGEDEWQGGGKELVRTDALVSAWMHRRVRADTSI
jgi:hypothetical protein